MAHFDRYLLNMQWKFFSYRRHTRQIRLYRTSTTWQTSLGIYSSSTDERYVLFDTCWSFC